MRTKTIELFKASELSEDAKERAHNSWLNNWDDPWASERKATLDAFADIFPVHIKDWSYGWRGEGVYFEMTCDDNISELSGLRLAKYIHNNYGDKLFTPKYYGVLIPHVKDKDHPAGLEHIKRYSKCQREASCVLTGYCADEDILGPIYAFLKKSYNITFKELLQECFDAWVTASREDSEACASMEYFIEHADANDMEYDENGRRA